jgi:hypothetical protein
MWTSNHAALDTADRRLCELLGIPAPRTAERLYTRTAAPERWSDGLAKRLFDVIYTGWQSPRLFRLRWDPLRNVETAWQEFHIAEPPIDWHALPQATPVTDSALRARIVAQVQSHFSQPVHLFDLLSYGRPQSPTLFDGEIWSALPREQILIRLNADTGDLMGWRHNNWFADGTRGVSVGQNQTPSASEGPPAPPPPDEESLRQKVESLPLFPKGLQRADAWPSTDRPGHMEMLWKRFEDGEEVENDSLYAAVNVTTGQVPECVLNWSTLTRDLDLDPAAARQALHSAFAQQFPGAVRCGMVRRMFVELPGQTAKPRAWVANAIAASGPVQIALGPGGAILRTDSIT